MKIYFISIFMMFVLSCNNKVTQTTAGLTDQAKTEKKSTDNEPLPECLKESVTVGEVIAKEGSVVKVADQLMIAFGTSSRCIPCNMPAHIKEGDQVTFSGNIKQAPAGVRMAGTPICLIVIDKI